MGTEISRQQEGGRVKSIGQRISQLFHLSPQNQIPCSLAYLTEWVCTNAVVEANNLSGWIRAV